MPMQIIVNIRWRLDGSKTRQLNTHINASNKKSWWMRLSKHLKMPIQQKYKSDWKSFCLNLKQKIFEYRFRTWYMPSPFTKPKAKNLRIKFLLLKNFTRKRMKKRTILCEKSQGQRTNLSIHYNEITYALGIDGFIWQRRSGYISWATTNALTWRTGMFNWDILSLYNTGYIIFFFSGAFLLDCGRWIINAKVIICKYPVQRCFERTCWTRDSRSCRGKDKTMWFTGKMR